MVSKLDLPSVALFLELNFARPLDEVAKLAAARGEEIGDTVTSDVVAFTGGTALKCLNNR